MTQPTESTLKDICRVCNQPSEDFICIPCDNEYAEWLDEKGLVVGEFDCYDHPNYQPDVHKGTKWDKMND